MGSAGIVSQLEEEQEDQELDVQETAQEQSKEAVTDGGNSDLPLRDSKGRFTTSESGGSTASVSAGWDGRLLVCLV